ncbi:succinate dehydrogenase assembly factor 3, mitochondrial [Diorhabda sublineata]|uniref:succinate dehydrogenase assembly factor 3, mitochondrial n=1 Tax=Diorhabda sublineata TaxID=1163346 RepID=UPI0024E0CC97|nr:succinate dehydrogenase assembly factor 3, mitochondrial [Diorhabda sublineata]XP_056636193.1 succinate dehydrogenase assembly factor 3, mitochondrial [Diorhabda sublineata]XP_056636194.1 succinate dehydrogenase assembly factor 3, mitochondrial [Diorhabda sublineata]
MTYTHVQRVRILYKTILKLHRSLPNELQIIGTNYAREEFKRHKRCSRNEANIFMNEWTNYAITLAKQLGLRGPQTGSKKIGSALAPSALDQLRDDQIIQLYELKEESSRAKNTEGTVET